MDFRITGLPAGHFAALHDLSDDALHAQGALRRVVDRAPGYPCRVSLQDAALGETVLLLNYEHMALDSPYRSRHAIYVRRHAREARLAVNEVPAVLAIRLLSVRAFDRDGMIVDADVVPGAELAVAVRRLLGNDRAEFLHVHNAKYGCYAARVDRAGPP
jgi:hypothetical protein